MKSVVKEIVILVLLLIVVFLILAIIFYEYMPMSIIVPEKVQAYSTPSEIEEEKTEDIVGFEKQDVRVEITASDLKKYSETGEYISKKTNPFLPYYDYHNGIDEDSADYKVYEDIDLGQTGEDPNFIDYNTVYTKNENPVFDTKIK